MVFLGMSNHFRNADFALHARKMLHAARQAAEDSPIRGGQLQRFLQDVTDLHTVIRLNAGEEENAELRERCRALSRKVRRIRHDLARVRGYPTVAAGVPSSADEMRGLHLHTLIHDQRLTQVQQRLKALPWVTEADLHQMRGHAGQARAAAHSSAQALKSGNFLAVLDAHHHAQRAKYAALELCAEVTLRGESAQHFPESGTYLIPSADGHWLLITPEQARYASAGEARQLMTGVLAAGLHDPTPANPQRPGMEAAHA